MAEMEYDIHKQVLLGVKSTETMNNSVFITLELAFYIQRGSWSSSTESTMLPCHVSTVAQNEQT